MSLAFTPIKAASVSVLPSSGVAKVEIGSTKGDVLRFVHLDPAGGPVLIEVGDSTVAAGMASLIMLPGEILYLTRQPGETHVSALAPVTSEEVFIAPGYFQE